MTRVVEHTPQPEKAGQEAPNGGHYATAKEAARILGGIEGVTVIGGKEPPMKA